MMPNLPCHVPQAERRVRAGHAPRRGIVLAVVLLIIGLLTLAMGGFLFFVRAELAGVRAASDQQQARLAAESGLEGVVALLRGGNRDDAAMWWDQPPRFRHALIWGDGFDEQSDPMRDRTNRIEYVTEAGGELKPAWRAAIVAPRWEGPEGTMRFGLTPESSRLNLNTATADQLRQLIAPVAVALGIEAVEPLVAAIMDWRDDDNTTSENGAENEYYNTLEPGPPYNCKNARFDTVEELLLVKGFTAALLYGEDVNRNGILDDNENDGDVTFPEYDNADGLLNPGIAPFLTVFGREPDTASDNKPRINLNGPAAQIQAQHATYFPEGNGLSPATLAFIAQLKQQNFNFAQLGSPAELYLPAEAEAPALPSGNRNGGPRGGRDGLPTRGGGPRGGRGPRGADQGGGDEGAGAGDNAALLELIESQIGDQLTPEERQRLEDAINNMGGGNRGGAGEAGESDDAGGGDEGTTNPRGGRGNRGNRGDDAGADDGGQQDDAAGSDEPDDERPRNRNPRRGGRGRDPGTAVKGITFQARDDDQEEQEDTSARGGRQDDGEDDEDQEEEQDRGNDTGQEQGGAAENAGGGESAGSADPNDPTAPPVGHIVRLYPELQGSPVTLEELPILMDYFTVRPVDQGNRPMEGLVNVNAAPARVLQLIPGMTTEMAGAIVAARAGEAEAGTRRNTAWLVTSEALTALQYKKIAPYTTAKAYQQHVEVIGYADHSRQFKRYEWIIEMIGPLPQVKYHRDLTRLGLAWPIDSEEAVPVGP